MQTERELLVSGNLLTSYLFDVTKTSDGVIILTEHITVDVDSNVDWSDSDDLQKKAYCTLLNPFFAKKCQIGMKWRNNLTCSCLLAAVISIVLAIIIVVVSCYVK